MQKGKREGKSKEVLDQQIKTIKASLAGSSNLHSNSRNERSNMYTSGVVICLTWNAPLAAASMRKHGEDSDSSCPEC